MRQFYSAKSVKPVLLMIAMIAAVNVNATPLDCTAAFGADASAVQCVPNGEITSMDSVPALKETTPVALTNAAPQGFHINQARSPRAVPESVPLLILLSAIITVLLVRAKRFNTK